LVTHQSFDSPMEGLSIHKLPATWLMLSIYYGIEYTQPFLEANTCIAIAEHVPSKGIFSTPVF